MTEITSITTSYGTIYRRVGKTWQRKRREEKRFKRIIPEVVPLHVLRKFRIPTF